MSIFSALYYPSWNPPVAWLRSVLLFYDQIQVIRPKDVTDPQYDPANSAVFELIPHAFGEIRKKHYEMTLDVRNKDILTRSLDAAASNVPMNHKHRFAIRIAPGGDISVPGYSLLHVSKLPSIVESELKRRDLVLEKAEPNVLKILGKRNFRIVEQNASNIILAMIADHYSRQNQLRSITDKDLGYLTSVLNHDPHRRRDAAATHLATAIISVEVPEKIGALTPKQYVDLRNRFECIRAPFQRAVRTICDDHLLASISSKAQFRDATNEAVRDFYLEVERIRKRKWSERLGTWGPMSLGVVSTLCSFGSTITVGIGASVDVCLKVYDALKPGIAPVTDVQAAQQMMASLRSEMIAPSLARKLLTYAKR